MLKRKMLPLVGIAFVMAVISTAVFYGLFAGQLAGKLRANAPDQSPLPATARNPERGAATRSIEASPVPAGMRAVSVHASESTGIVGLLRPGSKVDLQAVSARDGTTQLRTILQNVAVLNVSSQGEAAHGGRDPVPVLTVLTKPEDADAVALADSGARVRVVLRNPADDGWGARPPVAMASLFPAARSLLIPNHAGSNTAVDRTIPVQVQVVSAGSAAWAEIRAQLASGDGGSDSPIASFRPGTGVQPMLRRLGERRELEVLSAIRIAPGAAPVLAVNAVSAACDLRLRLSSGADARGRPHLRIEPEISWKRASGMERRSFHSEVAEPGSYVLTGLLADRGRAVLGGLFPGHVWENRELLIVITSEGRGR